MSVRGLYPVMVYTFVVFVQGLYKIGFDGFKDVQWDTWNILYAAEMGVLSSIVVMLPVLALCCFDPTDKNNVYIYWRMYGKQLP